jgi:hypothetical protein
VDPASRVDKGPQRVPNPPRKPYPPRYFPARRISGHLHYHASRWQHLQKPPPD